MPRRSRITLPGIPLHLIQRGNNRQACFFADDDYRAYLNWLEEYGRKKRGKKRGQTPIVRESLQRTEKA